MNNDNDEFAEYMCNQFSDSYHYEMEKRALARDTRLNKTRFSSVDDQYKDLKSWENSADYAMTNVAKKLLSTFPIDNDHLKMTMMKNYGVSNQDYDTILGHLANSKDVSVEKGFDGSIKLRRVNM